MGGIDFDNLTSCLTQGETRGSRPTTSFPSFNVGPTLSYLFSLIYLHFILHIFFLIF